MALVMMTGAVWWLCERSDAIAFLPAHAGAEWITDSAPPQNLARRVFPLRAVFSRSFTIAAPSPSATLTVRAFRNASVTINGQAVDNLTLSGKNWKSPTISSIAGLLHAGTNNITVSVTNQWGPPALWLRLQVGNFSLGSDESWRDSLAGAAWQQAHRASHPVPIPAWSPLCDRGDTLDSLRQVWPEVMAFSVVAFGLIWGVGCWQASGWGRLGKLNLIYLLFALVVIARTALFIHDMSGLPQATGFDALAHEKYIRFIQDQNALPLPNDGWEMHQPPLYYLGSAVWLNLCGWSAGSDEAVIPLRAVNGVFGWIHCWLVLLCLRRLFPKNLSAQAVGLLIAAFLPPHLYLAMYVTNDLLAGLLVTTAFYWFLRVIQSENESVWRYAGIGLALGAALLAKLSALLAVPVFLLALGLRLILRRNVVARDWWQSVGVVALVVTVVCGWHYGRVWMQIGAIPLPNSQTDPALAWWQDPGFRTAAYYLNYGQALASPLFSGLHGFADGIYATLWGDGLISGKTQIVFRPPWNYDLMNAGYLLSLAITMLALLGLAVSLRKFLRQPDLAWFVMLTLLFAFLGGIVFLTLQSPWLASVKAFYALPALVPFCAVIVVGWSWLAEKNRRLRILLWLVVLVWSLTTYSTYWIRGNNFETWRNDAVVQLQRQHFPEAIESITHALQLNPNDADSHCILAEALNNSGKPAEAIGQYDEALRLSPDSPDILNDLAQRLASNGKNAAGRAVKLARRACELTGYRAVEMLNTLASACANAGQFEAAVSAAEKACAVAAETGETEWLKTSQAALVTDLNNYAWRLATSPNPAIRDGKRAIQLAERACNLTMDPQPIFLGTLAAAYAEAGSFDEAITTAQKACTLAQQNGQMALFQRNQELLELYRAHRPYHEPDPLP